MATEIERKFLVVNDSWRDLVCREEKIMQGYLANTERGSIRVRLTEDKASLNIKSMTIGVERTEFDYPIPAEDAHEMLKFLCLSPIIIKTRYIIEQGGHIWEVDVFEGENAGLVVAEIELANVEEVFQKPDWAGEEVSEDARYYNVSLVAYPYNQWQDIND